MQNLPTFCLHLYLHIIFKTDCQRTRQLIAKQPLVGLRLQTGHPVAVNIHHPHNHLVAKRQANQQAEAQLVTCQVMVNGNQLI